ncbi:rod-binding protein [Paenirhodobacter enshiensis]|uniref:rod-binding protein n=2 Tax=Paenirhodobacter enshiensis TaxID=1105367 RepID=UPI0035B41DB9
MLSIGPATSFVTSSESHWKITTSLLLDRKLTEYRLNRRQFQMISPISGAPAGHEPARAQDPRNIVLRDRANQLEAAFLSQMLATAGVGKVSETMGGGAGEEQFSSFLREAYAEKTVAAGGIGLAETIFQSLAKGQTDD